MIQAETLSSNHLEPAFSSFWLFDKMREKGSFYSG